MDVDLDAYFREFEALVEMAVAAKDTLHVWLDALLISGDAVAGRVVAQRRKILTESDRNAAAGYLATGFYRRDDTDTRVAAVIIALELEAEVYRRRLAQKFVRYGSEQPLFRAVPSLLASARDGELLPIDLVGTVDQEGIAKIGRTFCRLDAMLPASIVHWVRERYPNAPSFVRIDPDLASSTRPRGLIQETVLVPADPRWWSGLSLHTRGRTGGVYQLNPPVNPGDDVEAYWQYHIGGLRRLETSAHRREEKYLSMMLEELQFRGDLLIGRCIHCDTSAPVGTPPGEAELRHIDLAINVYAPSAANTRLDGHLREGKVADASFRTHLLRLEGVPAETVIPLAFMFFRSNRLIEEMINDQFAPSPSSSEA